MQSRDETNNADTKEISMSPLPPYQRPEMWDITEDDFWRRNAVQRQEQYARASQRWNHGRQSTTEHIWSLKVELRQLREKEDKLSRELMAVLSQAALADETFNHESQRLSNMDVQHDMEQWVPSELIGKGPPERQVKLPPLSKLGLLRQQPNDDDRVVAIIDAGGTELDKLPDPGVPNERTTTIFAQTMLPPIELGDPRRFHAAMKPSIYNITDGKGTDWISSMIQVTDTLQKKKCQGCIAVGGDLYSECGNCEWNDTRYQGFEPLFPTNISASRSCSLAPLRTRSRSLTPPKLSGLKLGSPTTANLTEIKALTAPARETSAKEYAAHCNPFGLSVSGFKAVNQASMCKPGAPVPSAVPSLTASDVISYRRGSKASLSSCPTSRESLIFRPVEYVTPSSCDDITKENLELRHDGKVYTYPTCIEGVPVEKITSDHPYWEPKWPNLRLLVEPILRSWEEKYQAAEEASRRGEAVGSVKYQYGRQVNRGNLILKFLEQGTISPYQLLRKRYMAVGKGSITSYDTLFRLCETIESLAKYKTDVDPVDWLRQRLHELIEAQGTGFNFSKTIHDFYNDLKLQALRQKSGFKSIGRPSGIKMPRQRAGSANEAPSAHRSRKRKSPHSYDAPSAPADSIGEPRTVDTDADRGPDQKKQKAAARVLDSLETGEVSDVDSWSGAPIAEYDFGIYQIKTRLFISSGNVTQYWVWVPENSMFEHQVLVETNPVVWGVHREPIDFSLRLKDVVKVSWNLKALRVYVVMSDRQTCSKKDKPRGDIMVAFKRENTLRRFVTLCRREEIELVEETWKKMEHLWRTMQSERLLAGEETRARGCRDVFPSHSGSAVSKTEFWSYT
ncbi:hypothetical protein BBAD15_g11838 [Beauveria bassiana D1-5]|uniref:Uncharacterized protein n=1 Tax=Beauveria bassiana D1-5 TaxID=1245745 RepID=A0A0A2V620_BEABA|nr:hypothetical protein BBAD15_g11838 [Beauveria bassiana D1-5]